MTVSLNPELAEAVDEPPVGRTDACKSSVPLGVHSTLFAAVSQQAPKLLSLSVWREEKLFLSVQWRKMQVYVSSLSALFN